MLISKKDLLVETGISYGQLYRWKREHLIPEEWFIKQPSFTGQETFFPREKILARIRVIQELKERYSLEELAKILSPEVSERNFTVQDLAVIEEIDDRLIPAVVQGMDKDVFSYIEVLMIIGLCQCKAKHNIPLGAFIDTVSGIRGYTDKIRSAGFILLVLDRNEEYYATLYQDQMQIFMDGRFHVLDTIRLDDISSLMKLKYRKKFQFAFDGDAVQDSMTDADKGYVPV